MIKFPSDSLSESPVEKVIINHQSSTNIKQVLSEKISSFIKPVLNKKIDSFKKEPITEKNSIIQLEPKIDTKKGNLIIDKFEKKEQQPFLSSPTKKYKGIFSCFKIV